WPSANFQLAGRPPQTGHSPPYFHDLQWKLPPTVRNAPLLRQELSDILTSPAFSPFWKSAIAVHSARRYRTSSSPSFPRTILRYLRRRILRRGRALPDVPAVCRRPSNAASLLLWFSWFSGR